MPLTPYVIQADDADAQFAGVAEQDGTDQLWVYTDFDRGHTWAQMSTAFGTVITPFGTDYQVDTGTWSNITPCSLFAFNAALAVGINGTSIRAVALSISSGVITPGTAITITTVTRGFNTGLGMCAIDSSTAVVVYDDGGGNIKAVVLTISGTVVTAHTSVTIDTYSGTPSFTTTFRVLPISTTECIAFYQADTAACQVITVSGTVPTGHGSNSLTDGQMMSSGAAQQDSANFLALSSPSSGNVNARVVTVSGTAVTIHSPTPNPSPATTPVTTEPIPCAPLLVSGNYVVGYLDGFLNDLFVIEIALSGTTPVWGTAVAAIAGLGTGEFTALTAVCDSDAGVMFGFVDEASLTTALNAFVYLPAAPSAVHWVLGTIPFVDSGPF